MRQNSQFFDIDFRSEDLFKHFFFSAAEYRRKAFLLEVCEFRFFDLELEVTFELDSTTESEVRKSRTSERIQTYNNEIEPGHKKAYFRSTNSLVCIIWELLFIFVTLFHSQN